MSRRARWILVACALAASGCPSEPSGGAAPSSTAPRPRASASASAAGPASSSATLPPPAPEPPSQVEASEVQVGQVYRFLMKQGTTIIRESWTVTAVEPGAEVRYDLRSISTVPGQDPVEAGPTPKVAQLSYEDVPPPPGPAPVAKGQETLEVGEQRFECTIFEQGTTRSWISPRFPRTIKIEQDGQPFRTLIGIDSPQ